jgi:spermidine/putrescine transport system permease protein
VVAREVVAVLRTYVWLYLAFLLSPIVVIVLFSVHSSPSLSFPFQGFSLQWYAQLWTDPQIRQGIENSLIVASAASVITGVIGSLGALAFPRLHPAARSALAITSFAPIALPGLFLGIALVVLFAQAAFPPSLVTVTVAHVLFTLPFFVLAARTRIELFDFTLEEAARDLGAGPMQTLRLVTLPIIAPTLVGATIMCFALSFDEFIITSFVIGTQSTLPMVIWSMMRHAVTPVINAASTLALFLSFAVMALAGLVFLQQRRSERRRRAPRLAHD